MPLARRDARALLAPALGFLLGAVAAGIAVRNALSGESAAAAPAWVPLAAAGVAVLSLLVGLAALAHLLRRDDLPPAGRALLGVGAVVVPFGGVAYFALGPARTRDLARRLLGADAGAHADARA